MTENSTGAISLNEAVERLSEQEDASDEPVAIEETEGTGDSNPEETEVEAAAETEEPEDPEFEVDLGQGLSLIHI